MKHFKNGLIRSLVAMMVLGQITIPTSAKTPVTMAEIKAHHQNGYETSLINDGDLKKGWRSMPQNGDGDDYARMYDHNRYIDITLDGTYTIDEIQVFTEVDGSYSNYYIYASTDGENYSKIVSKTDNNVATETGDTHVLNAPVEACYLRLNMAYNSNRFETNLAELKVFGTKKNNTVTKAKPIEVSNWQGSTWQQEWDRFETDKAYANDKVVKEMSNLVERVIGKQYVNSFEFKIRESLQEGKDIFEITDGANGTIVISGNNGIAMASGFNHYLKNYLHVDYNPLFESQLKIESIVPVGSTITREAQFDLRYALNFCTYSYTMAFWNWDEYEAFLDWGAMNGVNLMLDIVGQEEVIRQTLREYNYTDEEIKDYIAGPAYFAWFYMQNLYSSGGPLPNSWFSQRVELGRKMHDRMQTFGMQPVIQGFSGQVPYTFADKNQGAVLTPKDGWVGYTRPSIIKTYLTPEEQAAGKQNYFATVANTFYEKQKNVFGDVSNYYACDPFHEGGNTGGLDVANIFKTVQDEMIKSNPNAIWVMQQWQWNLTHDKMSLMDTSKALALDLQSDMRPIHSIFEENGTPWIYCMLHNFGGRMGLDGEVPVISQDPMKTMHNSKNMTGIGITPEALENSPIVYELFFDTTWTKDPIDYVEWVKSYATRRAGGSTESLQQAWEILVKTAYADKKAYIQGAAESVVNARPTYNYGSASTWGHSTIEYDKKLLDQALVLLTENYDTFKNSPAFKYDFADVAEQVLSNSATLYHSLMVQAKNNNDLPAFEQASTKFLALIDLSDEILSSSKEFLVGTWINDAREMIVGADDWTKDLFEFNARSLITTWGGQRVGDLKDYSNRKWAGLTKDFYKARWQIWIDNRLAELKGEAKDPAKQKAESNWFLWEFQWANRKSDDGFALSHTPANVDLKALATRAYNEFSVTNFTGSVEVKENILLGKVFTTTAQSTNDIKHITDGLTSTEWQTSDHQAVLEVDLVGTYDLDKVVLSFPQIAKEFPYTYKVEAFDGKVWNEYASDNSSKLSANVEITTPVTASKLRFTFTTTNPSNELVRITDIQAFGTEKQTEKLFNLALGVVPLAKDGSTDGGYPLTNITDDNDGSYWKTTTWGTGAYPYWVQVELPTAAPVKEVQVVFEKPGLPFQFKVVGIKADGSEVIIDDTYATQPDTLKQKAYSFYTTEDLKGVRIDYVGMTGKGDFYAAGPALAELRILSPMQPDAKIPNVKLPVSQGSNHIHNFDATVDGDKDTWSLVDNNQDLVYDLGGETYVSEAVFTFEKGELGLKYEIIIEKADGTRETVLDKSQTTELLGEREVRAKVDKNAAKVILRHLGNNGQGPAWAAEPRLYEVEIFGRPSATNITNIQAGNYVNLFDGSLDTTKTLAVDESFVVTLPKAYDINFVSAIKVDGVIDLFVEYEKDGKFIPFGRATSMNLEEGFAQAEKTAYASKFRFTAKQNMNLKEIKFYTEDYRNKVQKRIDEINQFVNAQGYEGINGHYTVEAKNTLLAEINRVQALANNTMNSVEANTAVQDLNKAFDAFIRDGRVIITRHDLLTKLVYTDAIIKALTDLNQTAAKQALETAFNEALAIYKKYDVTQVQINEQISKLDAALTTALQTLTDKEALDVKIEAAKTLLNSMVVGDLGGNYPQAVKDALNDAINLAKTEMVKENANYKALEQALEQSMQQAIAGVIVINKDALNAQIEASKQAITLDARNYDKNAYLAYQTALTNANNISKADDTTVSQANVDEAKDALKQATDTLLTKVLDFSQLQEAINNATSKNLEGYTKESVDAFNQALEAAKTVNTRNENTQEEIDQAKDALINATNNLAVDKEALQALVDTTVDTTNKQTMYVDAYNNALNNAKDTIKKPDATVEEVKLALDSLQEAITNLNNAEVVDKTALKQAIDTVVDRLNKPTDLLQAYDQALDIAQGVYNDGNASNKNVVEATDSLNAAIKALEDYVAPAPQPQQITATANKTNLVVGETAQITVQPEGTAVTFVVENNEVISVDSYGLVTALKAGSATVKVVPADKTTDPVSIVFVVSEEGTNLDTQALQDLINKVSSVNKDKYTEKSYKVFEDALNAAKAVLENKEATQDMVNKAVQDLMNAYNALESINANKPQTNDAFNMMPFAMMAMIALMGASFVVYKKKKEQI